ncbi:unnamed protein product [Pseudo-nitzschia multistriata]|uniref:Uncharacterized protein n=1 Tax=Pseudo-nitzschia multistriata TaxID=183589 RepID=A0A448YXR0_9STRA|nr:unnamed protein product [Pseudo-nitzschia multistriata]
MEGFDEVDIDDLFGGGGDMLFDGLDIALDDTLGDIISNDAAPAPVAPPSEPAPAPKTKRTGGPRTKRTNPMLEKPVAKEETAVTSPGNKRRKTKRKSKAPAAFGDDDEAAVEEQPPPKKKRKASAKTKKLNDASSVSSAKTKRKKLTGTASASIVKGSSHLGASNSLLTKSTKSSMVLPNSSVAAAGQFGGRLKKVGTTKVKRKLKKHADGASDSVALAATEVIKPPKPEPTYGGLAPSKTLFYPFLESVPAESTMQKRKTYPVMDRLSNTG